MNTLSLALDYGPLFLTGLRNTLLLLVVPMVLGTVLAVPLALLLTRRVPFAAPAVEAVSYVLRGTPLIVQVYLLYYGLAQFAAVRDSMLWPMLREAWTCLFIAFGLNSAAYLTQIFRGAIEAVPRGEVQAAQAVGMTTPQTLCLVVLPAAFRRALPSYENEVIFSLHSTAIASLVTVIDLLGAGRNFNIRHYFTFEGFLIAGAIYLTIVGAIRLAFALVERRAFAHLRRA